MPRILLVDDEENVLQALKRMLHRHFSGRGVIIETFANPEAALERASECEFDVVVSDYRMPIMDGITFLRCYKGMQPHTTRLMLSAATDFDALVTAINEIGIYRYLPKPWEDEDFACAIDAACRDYQRRSEERGDPAGEQALSPEALEYLRLEAEEPGITQVNWATDGSVILDDKDL